MVSGDDGLVPHPKRMKLEDVRSMANLEEGIASRCALSEAFTLHLSGADGEAVLITSLDQLTSDAARIVVRAAASGADASAVVVAQVDEAVAQVGTMAAEVVGAPLPDTTDAVAAQTCSDEQNATTVFEVSVRNGILHHQVPNWAPQYVWGKSVRSL